MTGKEDTNLSSESLPKTILIAQFSLHQLSNFPYRQIEQF